MALPVCVAVSGYVYVFVIVRACMCLLSLHAKAATWRSLKGSAVRNEKSKVIGAERHFRSFKFPASRSTLLIRKQTGRCKMAMGPMGSGCWGVLMLCGRSSAQALLWTGIL